MSERARKALGAVLIAVSMGLCGAEMFGGIFASEPGRWFDAGSRRTETEIQRTFDLGNDELAEPGGQTEISERTMLGGQTESNEQLTSGGQTEGEEQLMSDGQMEISEQTTSGGQKEIGEQTMSDGQTEGEEQLMSDGQAESSEQIETGGRSRVNVNTATAEELTVLPGIGPALAERIIAERTENGPFRYPEDLVTVKGIGVHKLAAILDLVSTE